MSPDHNDADHYDLVVIGSGPAGQKGAAQAANHGKRVAIVEWRPGVGGTPAATGGMPSKALRETALYVSGWRKRDVYGVSLELDPVAAFQRLKGRATEISTAMSEAVRDNITRHRIDLVRGRARLAPEGRVRVTSDDEERVLHAHVTLVATGSRPLRPPGIPFNGHTVLDSDEILRLDQPFRSMVIVGAGPVGCEYASIFAAVGVEVHLVEQSRQLLPVLDAEIARLLESSLRRSGLELALGCGISRLDADGDSLVVELDGGRVLHPDRLLFAAGRVSNTEDLGLETAGVEVDARGRIVVDESFRTTAENVYAAGDVIGPPALASVSMEQARVAMCDAFGIPLKQAVDRLPPVAVYTIPEAAGVGMTEDAARDAGVHYEVGRGWFERNPRAVIAGDTEGLVKLVCERKTGRLLGVHIFGDDAAELVHHGQAVIRHGGNIEEFVHATFNVPTRTDAYKYAAYDALTHLEVRAAFGDVAG
ncbi:MAG TPA: Si-specific NAD(P)(+) transhydrogenase [Acidimicrobiales bacterium]|nr:Si-specific NAD(P)(+) transhydrogenase [Acidimicrobiales bacterium]